MPGTFYHDHSSDNGLPVREWDFLPLVWGERSNQSEFSINKILEKSLFEFYRRHCCKFHSVYSAKGRENVNQMKCYQPYREYHGILD